MKRKDFLLNTGLLATMGLFSSEAFSSPKKEQHTPDLKPFMLPPLSPLEHNGGLNIRTKVRSEMTGGVYSSVETAVAPKTMGPPPHYHKELDELMFVQEGTASVLVGNDVVEIEAGGWHFRPRLIEHTFWNSGTTPLRFIDMYFNQAFEQYLEKLFFELNEQHGYPDGSTQKINAMNNLNEKFGLVFSSTAFQKLEEIKAKYGLK